MKYVLLTHVPTYAGQSPGVVRLTERFKADLLAEATALRGAGFELTLSTPRFGEPDAKTLASERFADVRLADLGITDAPLPDYRTMRQFLRAKDRLEKTITAAVAGAGVVQLGAGGHPMALGQFAWPLINGPRRVFVFAGDPLPGRRRAVVSGRNPAKRLAKLLAVRQFDAFCRQAVLEADLVFAHDPAVARRFGGEWNDRCHTFTVPPIGDHDLAGPVVTAHRTRRLGDAARPLHLLARADATPTAGLDHLLRAVGRAKRLGAKLVLDLLPTPGGPTIEALREQSGLGDALNFVETPAADAFDAADLSVAAPLVPGENPSIFLAAARGLPMVSYKGGNADTALASAGGGVAVERGDDDALAQAMLDLCRDKARVADMAIAARAWAAGQTLDGVHRARAALVRALV